MDPFEPVRQAAATLHSAVTGTGPYVSAIDLVKRAANRLELDVCLVDPTDPTLEGGDAHYDEQYGLIVSRNDRDEGTLALLVGHELGHAQLHKSSAGCHGDDIDPSRPTDATPIGLQRVEDYGARERRELQANVFARELLLPRTEALRLHLAVGLGAKDISERLAIPLGVVRQQLLDALLLPPTGELGPPVRGMRPSPPDASQQRAVEHDGSAFQLQAGPGTGKTRTLVTRVEGLLAKGVDPATILVLTFSNRAAGELTERIALTAPDAAGKIWVGTFHAFGLDLVRRYYQLLGLPSNPPLFDRTDAIEVLERRVPLLKLRHYRNLWDPYLDLREFVGAISRAKDEMVGPAEYARLADAQLTGSENQDDRVRAEKAIEVATVYALYEDALRKRGAVDFGDLIMLPTLLLEQNEAVRATVQARHRHILVDEYQDINRASGRLVRAVAGDGRRLWVVGDSRQSIYRFRGASSSNMSAFFEDFPGAVADRLEVNYRSTTDVVGTFVRFAATMDASDGMLPLVLSAATQSHGVPPQVIECATPHTEAADIADAIRSLEARGVALRDQAVLCRANARLNDLAKALEGRGIPVLHLGSLFERDEIRDLLALMSLYVDRYGDGLARVGAFPRYGIPVQDVSALCRQLRDTTAVGTAPAAARLPELLRGAYVQRPLPGLLRLAKDLESLVEVSPWELAAGYLLDTTRHLAQLASEQSPAHRMQGVAIWQFLNFLRDQSSAPPKGPPIRAVLDRVRNMVLLAEERDLRHVPNAALHMDAVRLMTIHGSKGLEFEAVHVPALMQRSFPVQAQRAWCPPPNGMILGPVDERRAQVMEEECLFFVALSRAKRHLRITWSSQTGTSKREISPFVARAVPHGHRRSAIAGSPLAADRTILEVAWASVPTVTERQLAVYQNCPRRYYYTHVLQLGGARRRTPFIATHAAVSTWVRECARRQVGGPVERPSEVRSFDAVWNREGPYDDPLAAEYRALAARLMDNFLALDAAGAQEPDSLNAEFANGRVLVSVEQILLTSSGRRIVRRVKTGRKSTDEFDKHEYTLLTKAARDKWGSAVSVEAAHLSDGTSQPVELTTAKLTNRLQKIDELLHAMQGGDFTPNPSPKECPQCPHFFVCGAVPSGRLEAPA